MLSHLIRRLRQTPSLDGIVLATTTNQTDDVLEQFARSEGISVFRGSEADVMGRVIGAGRSVAADVIVEITGDCPLLDPDIVGQVIQLFRDSGRDYVSNIGSRETFPGGMDAQVFRLATLEKSYSMTDRPLDREHVTYHIRSNPEIFSQATLDAPAELHWPELQLMLDEPKDYELLRRILEHFGEKKFRCRDIIELLRRVHPEWTDLNKDVHRKGYT